MSALACDRCGEAPVAVTLLLATLSGAAGGACLASWWWVRRVRLERAATLALLVECRTALRWADFDELREPRYEQVHATIRRLAAALAEASP